jgi:hypothetical protein
LAYNSIPERQFAAQIFLTWAFIFLCSGCSSFVDPTYAIKDSGRNADSLSNIYWLDNRHVLFQGITDRDYVRSDGFRGKFKALYLWDVVSGAIEERGEIGGGLCYAEGYIRYWRWKGEPSKGADWIAGEFGHEVKVDESVTDPKRLDWKTCKPRSDPPLPDWTQGDFVWRLRSGHGFLVLGSDREARNSPVTYYPDGGPKGVLMPFKRREFDFSGITFFPFKGAYLVSSTYFMPDSAHPYGGYDKYPWPKGALRFVWWLYPDGRIEEIRLPSEESRSTPSTWIFAAIPGIFFVDAGSRKNELVHIVDGKTHRILSGNIYQRSVSPNGCRIAIDHDENGNHMDEAKGGTMKVLEVCN